MFFQRMYMISRSEQNIFLGRFSTEVVLTCKLTSRYHFLWSCSLAEHEHLDMRTSPTSAHHICWSLARFSAFNPHRCHNNWQLSSSKLKCGISCTPQRALSISLMCIYITCAFFSSTIMIKMLKQEINLECWLNKLSVSLCMFLQFFMYDA